MVEEPRRLRLEGLAVFTIAFVMVYAMAMMVVSALGEC